MNAYPNVYFSARRALCLAASILGLLFLAWGVAPGTVLASSATDVYTEEPPPPTPVKNHNGNQNNGGNQNNSGNQSGGNDSSGSGSSDYGSSGSSGSGDSSTGGSSSDDGSANQKQYSKGGYNPATDSDKSGDKAKAGTGSNSEDDSTASATPAGGNDSDGGGGSALPLILAILIGVPLIAGGAYYAWVRYRVKDDETKDRLKSALDGGKPSGT